MTDVHLLFLLITLWAWPGRAMSLERMKSGEYINRYSTYFIDAGDKSAEEVFEKRADLFSKEPGVPHSMGQTDKTFWMLVEIGGDQFEGPIVLANLSTSTDHVDLYQFNSQLQLVGHFRGGDKYPFKDRYVPYRYPNFKVELGKGTNHLLFRMTSNEPLLTPVRFWRHSGFLSYALVDSVMVGLLIGSIMAIGVYNFFLYISIRDKLYLYYSLFITAQCTYNLFSQGIFLYIDPTRETSSWSLNQGMYLFMDLTIFSAAIFSWHFLNMKKKMPVLSVVTLIFSGITVISFFARLFYSTAYPAEISIGTAGVMSIVLFIAGILASVRSYGPAFFYAGAWAMVVCANLYLSISVLGLTEFYEFSMTFLLIAGVIEGTLLSFALGYRIKLSQKKEDEERKKKDHYFVQLMKVFYPHQLDMMREGHQLEETMPTTSSEACVICFDIVGSSKIKHEKSKEFFMRLFRRCSETMMDGYDSTTMTANAFRIKEMGDGFLCSVGYPFKSITGHMARDALNLAMKFFEIFQEEVEALDYRWPIHCGIGIALEQIAGFYPETGTKEYDLYGQAIILATRYEGMRKVICGESLQSSILILQERVLVSLTSTQAQSFVDYDVDQHGITVRDDPAAKKVYYKYLGISEQTGSEETSKLKKAG